MIGEMMIIIFYLSYDGIGVELFCTVCLVVGIAWCDNSMTWVWYDFGMI